MKKAVRKAKKHNRLKYILLLAGIILFGFFFISMFANSLFYPQTSNQLTLPKSKKLNQDVIQGKFFITSNNQPIIGLFTPQINKIQSLDETILQYTQRNEILVSPDGQKILVNVAPKEQKNLTFDYLIISTTNNKVKIITYQKISSFFGLDYDIRNPVWSNDNQSLVFVGRNIKTFFDNRCCEGGDYRSSNHLIVNYHLDSDKITTITQIKSSPFYVNYYDVNQHFLIYSSNTESIASKKDIISGKISPIPSMNKAYYNKSTNNIFYILRPDSVGTNPNNLMVYSVLENKTIPFTIPYGSYNDEIIWSPKQNYFAIKYISWTDPTMNGAVNNSLLGPGNRRLIRIYNQQGNSILSTVVDDFGSLIFSSDEKYLLVDHSPDSWQIIEIKTGNSYLYKLPNGEISSVVAWYN